MFEELPKNRWVPSSRMALFGAISGEFVLGLGVERMLLGLSPWDSVLDVGEIVVLAVLTFWFAAAAFRALPKGKPNR